MTSRMLATSPSSITQPVDAEPEARRRGQPVLEGAEILLVDLHGLLVVAGPGLGRLLLEAGALVVGVDELGEAVAQLAPGHHRLVALDQLGPVAVPPRQRARPRRGSRSRTPGPTARARSSSRRSRAGSCPGPTPSSTCDARPRSATLASSARGERTSSVKPVASATSSVIGARRHGVVRSRSRPP